MPRQSLSVNLTSASGTSRLAFELDPAHMSQRFILEELSAGRLYESETSSFVGGILSPGDAFIDIGAHVGYFTMLSSVLVGPTGTVVAFEPDASNHAHLLDRIVLNRASNVLPVPMAVSASPQVADFYFNSDNDGGHALWSVGNHPYNERTRQDRVTRKVFVTSLDSFFGDRTIPNLKAIKIDAEGAELSVLMGARSFLQRHNVPFIIAEINRFGLESMGTTETQLRSFMTSLGYETYLFQPGQTALHRMTDDMTVESDYVFNVMFRHPLAPALAA